MVKFSFFTVRSKCCKKSKFVVLFLFFFLCWICNFQILYILRLRFFFLFSSTLSTLITAVCYPRIMFLLNVLSLLCVCLSHSLSFLFRFWTWPWPRTIFQKKIFLRQQSPTANISQKKKRFPGEGETPLNGERLMHLIPLSLSHSETTSAKGEWVPAATINQPMIRTRERTLRYLRAAILLIVPLSLTHKNKSVLSSLYHTTPEKERHRQTETNDRDDDDNQTLTDHEWAAHGEKKQKM